MKIETKQKSNRSRLSPMFITLVIAAAALSNHFYSHHSVLGSGGGTRATSIAQKKEDCLLVFGTGFPKRNDRSCLRERGSSLYLQTMTKTLVGTPLGGSYDAANPVEIKPYNDRSRFYGADWPPYGYTMIGIRRMDNFRCAIQEVNARRIKGDIVELGVWRGGAMMLAAAIGRESGIERNLHLFDMFGTINSYSKFQESKRDFLAVSVNDVKANFKYFDLDGPTVNFEVGMFKDTVPKWKDRNVKIAVLRIDGNFYDSYQDAMYNLYEKVPVGGIVIFDDLSKRQKAVKRFWEDFKADQELSELPINIDGSSAWFRKEKDIKIDWQHFRRPQDVNLPPNTTISDQ